MVELLAVSTSGRERDEERENQHPVGATLVRTRSIRSVQEVSDLSAIFEDHVNVVTLSRRLDPLLAEEVQRALRQPTFRVLASISPEEGPAALNRPMTEFPRLAAELFFWSAVLADLVGCAVVGVRVVRREGAMCPRFHVDKVTLRVVTTLAGNGTELLAEQDIDRRWLGHAALGERDELSGLLRTGARIERAGVGDVVLLKGEAWPGNAGRGAVHRSPEASAAAPRLVVTLDPL